MAKTLPKYPIYIPSKGRAEISMTGKFLVADGTPFCFVVEPQERDTYVKKWGAEHVLTLPENDQGLIYSRNWIWQHSVLAGAERHWQIDDNINRIRLMRGTKRIPVNSAIAFRACEDFTDRYENVALSGLNYTMFLPPNAYRAPFILNAHVYSCTLILNSLPYRFRPPANEDVDMCLQVLSGGWCTIQFCLFNCEKRPTMKVKGGQTDSAYLGDGRLFMARQLERVWPGVVETKRRYNRPQHVIRDGWKKFDTPLRYKPGIKKEDFTENDYGLKLLQIGPIESPRLKEFIEQHEAKKK